MTQLPRAPRSSLSATPPRIARHVLAPHEQTVRLPLDVWAAEILSILESASDDPIGQTTFCANNASLVLAYAGDRDRSKAICEAQLAWVARLGESAPDRYVHAVQPWVNLGRLALLAGATDRAIEHFRATDPRLGHSGAQRFGSLAVPDGAWEREGVGFAERVSLHAVDVLRAMLQTAGTDPASVVAFATRFAADLAAHPTPGPRAAAAADVLAEGHVVGLLLGGDADRAALLALAHAREREALSASRLAFDVRQVECLLAGEHPDTATSVLASLTATIADLDRAPRRSDVDSLFVAFAARRSSELACLLGDGERALALAKTTLARARALRDEVLTIETLDWLGRLGDADALSLAARARANTLYHRFRATTPRTSPPSERGSAIVRLFNATIAALARG